MSAGPVEVAGRYRLGESLGSGGMGQVWLARDQVLDRDVAVKEILLPPDLVAGERDTVHRRMVQEARAAARLSHPNVAQVYDVVEDDGRAWIVMEYVPSRSLQEVIREDGPLEPRWAAVLGLDLLDALDAAHQAGVRHRDVKPANVLLGDDGRIVLTDFGIASIEGDSVITTSSEVVLGSPQYMSPERARDGTAEPASDLWSLGATLYYAVEGRSPFQRDSAMGTLTAVAADEPDPPRRAGAMATAFEGLLRKDPDERIDTVETRRLLRAAAEVTEPGVAAPARSRRPLLVTAGVTAVVLLAGGTFAWVTTRPDDREPVRGQAGSAPSVAATTTSPVPSSAPSTTPSKTPSQTPSSAPVSSAPANGLPPIPAGWHDYRDATGFSVYVPDGWAKSRKKTSDEYSMVYFRDPEGGRVMGIDQTDSPQWDPVGDWEGKAAYRSGRGDFPGYDEISIKEVEYLRKAADWEYTFTENGSRRHVVNRGVVASENKAYGLYWSTRAGDWDAARADLRLFYASFRPTKG
ncbi:serine/threonine-protein kinase [Actinoplanes sp. NPDC051494]|uniref:serine/threonine-protein kinase n=1 Tax=Actinoplanes sp. NPDC051494 TaxID=3363907 RepID=UPI00379E2BA1